MIDPVSQAYPVDLYDAVHVGTPGDVAFYQSVCAGADSVLELGCGSGRMLAALARDGRRLVGLDKNAAALDNAAALVPTARLVLGKMEELALDEQFDRVIAPFSSLYCLADENALKQTLAAAVRHLRPGGQLVADVWNAEELHTDGEAGDDEPSPLLQIEVRGTTYYVYESSRWDRERQLLTAIYEHRVAEGDSIVATIPHRYFLRSELERALSHSGARTWRLESDFAGAPWSPTSELTVLRAAL